MAQKKMLRKKKSTRKGPRRRKKLTPKEEVDEGLCRLGLDLEQLGDEVQELERTAGEIGGTLEELGSELNRLRAIVEERGLEESKAPQAALPGKLTCCHDMVMAQKPGSVPHVMRNAFDRWAIDGAPFNVCPWCGKPLPKA